MIFEELTLEKLETFLLRFADERRTGQLKIQGEGARGGRIDLREGRIVAAESPFVSESLGEIARKLGLLSKADLQRAIDALSRADNAGKQLQDILLDEKLLARDSLETCLRYQAESSIFSMIGFHGRISFMPGNVSSAEVELDPRQVLSRMKERDHVEEMGSAFLEIVDSGPPLDDEKKAPSPAEFEKGGFVPYESESEIRRIAAAAIREVATAAQQMQTTLDAQAEAVAEEMLEEGHEPHVAELPHSLVEPVLDTPVTLDTPDRPRLARVVLEICRPGSASTEALLDFATHFAKRAILFAATSKGLKIAGHKAQAGHTFDEEKIASLLLSADPDGALGKVMHERIPSRGVFEPVGESDKTLESAVMPLPPGDTILFPIALHERAIGLLYGDGVPAGDPGLLEDLAAAVASTAVVMENKLFARQNSRK